MAKKPFWNWQACREFIEEAVRHYRRAPAWFTTWLDDLYVRLDERQETITLEEISTLGMLMPESDGVWEGESYACNRVYKFFRQSGRDTTGIAGY